MTPIPAANIRSLDSLPLVRYLGPDGGWRGGRLLPWCIVGTWTILDVIRGEIVYAANGEWERDHPRDDAGNVRDQ